MNAKALLIFLWFGILEVQILVDLLWGFIAPCKIPNLNGYLQCLNLIFVLLHGIRMICGPYENLVSMLQTFLFITVRIIAGHVIAYATSNADEEMEKLMKQVLESIKQNEAKTAEPTGIVETNGTSSEPPETNDDHNAETEREREYFSYYT